MKLIDRYVYAATKHLTEDTREDVSRELRANIEDMLPENPTEKEVREALLKLGNPRILANEYSQTKRYLIGPSLYDNYISILKLVTGIVAIVVAILSLLDGAFLNYSDGTSAELGIEVLVNVIASVFEGVVQAAVWVTLIFAVLERTGANEGKVPFLTKEWSPEDLPEIPVSNKSKISRGETIFSMVSTIFFTALLYFRPQLIGVYTRGKDGLEQVAPLFDVEGLRPYVFIIVVLAIIQLVFFIWKFISKHWNVSLAFANAALSAAVCILVVLMINDNSIFNSQFLPAIASHTRTSVTQIESIWSQATKGFTIVFIAISIWDSVATFLKLKK